MCWLIVISLLNSALHLASTRTHQPTSHPLAINTISLNLKYRKHAVLRRDLNVIRMILDADDADADADDDDSLT